MSKAAGEGGGAGPARRWVKPLLIVSLALNLLFAGLIAGSIWKFRHGGWQPMRQVLELSIQEMMRELPAEKRTAGEAALAKLRNEVAPLARSVREARAEATQALKADPYDHQRFSDAMARIRDIHARRRQGRHEAVLEFVRDMTVAQRHRFFEIFRSHLRKGRLRKYRAGDTDKKS